MRKHALLTQSFPYLAAKATFAATTFDYNTLLESLKLPLSLFEHTDIAKH